MLHRAQPLVKPLLSLIFVVLATAYFVTFTTLELKTHGLSDQIVGFMHSGYYAGMLLSSFICQALILRLGHAKAFILSSLVSAVSMFVMAWDVDPISWIAMRFFAGGCMGVIYIVVESWLLAYSTVNDRGQILAIYTIALYLSQALGQYFIDFIPASHSIPYLIAGLLTLTGIIPYLLEKRTGESESTKEAIEWSVIIFNAPFGVIGSAISGAVLSVIYSFTPVFAVEYEISASVLMSLTIFGGVCLQWPLGRLSDKYSRSNVLIFTCLGMFAPCMAICFFPDNPWNVLVNSFLLGGLAFTIYPQSISLVTVQMPSISFTAATAVALLTYGLGSMFGPLIVPVFSTQLGIASLYGVIAALSGIFAIGGLTAALVEKPMRIPE